MNGSFFLDTNIFVYCFDEGAPRKSRRASQLVREAVATRKGMISYQVVQEFFHVALRRFAQPMSTFEAEQYFSAVFRPLLTVHSSPALYLEALRLSAKHNLSWYDSLIIAGAMSSRCEVLYSEDLQHGRKFESLTITNPFL